MSTAAHEQVNQDLDDYRAVAHYLAVCIVENAYFSAPYTRADKVWTALTVGQRRLADEVVKMARESKGGDQ